MLGTTSPALWYLTRGTGIMSLLLLTMAVVLGLLTAGRAGGRLLPRFAVSELHRRVALVAVVLVIVHVLSAVADKFVHISLVAVVIPFTSAYAPGWVGLGAVALDLLAAVVVTSLLRRRLPTRLWRGVHWAAYASWPVAVAHSVGLGSDMRFSWLRLTTTVCILSVLAALAWRLWARPHRPGLHTAIPQAPAGVRSESPVTPPLAGSPGPTVARSGPSVRR